MPIFESPSGGDFGGDEDRPIPDIPGVSFPEPSIEDSGTLYEHPDEDSNEDVLEEVSRETRQLLNIYGVEGLNAVSHAEIIEFWGDMEMSQHLIADLALYSTTQVQRLGHNQLAKATFNDLRERRATTDNPYDFRGRLIEDIAPNLIGLGYSELDAYRLPRSRDEDLALAFKVEGWLLGQFFMEDLPGQIKTAVRTAPEHKIDRSVIFGMTIDEIVRQARIIDSQEVQQRYDPRISSNVKAYRELRKTVRNAYKIANYAFAKFPRA